jgi:hypothetical protein
MKNKDKIGDLEYKIRKGTITKRELSQLKKYWTEKESVA